MLESVYRVDILNPVLTVMVIVFAGRSTSLTSINESVLRHRNNYEVAPLTLKVLTVQPHPNTPTGTLGLVMSKDGWHTL